MGQPAAFEWRPVERDVDRDPTFDGLRGVALIMVLLIHCFYIPPTGGWTNVYNALVSSAFIAVDIFFVLSGFLITGILLRTRDSEGYFRIFYVRRALRVLPPYYLLLVFIFLIYPRVYAPVDASGVANHWEWFALYVQNWRAVLYPQPLGWAGVSHLWSLAIEEQFYILWPLVVYAVPTKHFARVCLIIALTSAAARIGLALSGAHWLVIYVSTICRLDGLAMGAWIAAQWHLHHQREVPSWLRWSGRLAVAGLVALAFSRTGNKLFHGPSVAFHVLFATVAFSWLVFASCAAPAGAVLRRVLSANILTFLGRYSYGTYLIHWVLYPQIHQAVARVLPETLAAALQQVIIGSAVVAVSLPLAIIMFHLLEQPILSLKRYFRYGQRARPALVTQATVSSAST